MPDGLIRAMSGLPKQADLGVIAVGLGMPCRFDRVPAKHHADDASLVLSARPICGVRRFRVRTGRIASPAIVRTNVAHRAAGSMPLFLMSGAASGADMNFTIAIAASGCFEAANTPAENMT